LVRSITKLEPPRRKSKKQQQQQQQHRRRQQRQCTTNGGSGDSTKASTKASSKQLLARRGQLARSCTVRPPSLLSFRVPVRTRSPDQYVTTLMARLCCLGARSRQTRDLMRISGSQRQVAKGELLDKLERRDDTARSSAKELVCCAALLACAPGGRLEAFAFHSGGISGILVAASGKYKR
jgi:hypothetical protein